MRNLHIVLPLLAMAPMAHAMVIDFGSGPTPPTICSATADGLGSGQVCSRSSYVSQSHGDVAGLVDITYSQPRRPGESLHWWDTEYNSLYGVAWAGGGDGNSHARIEIKPLNGQPVQLIGFDIGAFANTTRASTVAVYSVGGGSTLFSSTGNVGSGTTPTHIDVNGSSANGVWIEYQDSAFNVGIDNIQFNVGVVPEPGAAALLALGLAAIALTRRARH